jgi:DNA helicase-2/ATP-dependent DNA helicase PcrA
MNIAQILHESANGLVVAPAGYGKTHLIAEAVINYGQNQQLILTHTHAGVDSIKSKIRRLSPGAKNIHVETIDGFILRYVASYPKTSGWRGSFDDAVWDDIRKCGINLFKKDFIKKVIKNTYAGLYVDEYQDCSQEQHAIVIEVMSVLPVRVLGDQLQGIFNFGHNQIVDWGKDVNGSFDVVGELATPWRWNNAGNPELGSWLSLIRQAIINNQSISLSNLPACVSLVNATAQNDVIRECHAILSRVRDDESIVIIGIANQAGSTHSIASKLRGRCGVVEPLESKDLRKIITELMDQCVYKRAIALLKVAGVCFSGISESVLTQEFKALKKKQLPNRRNSICLSDPLKNFIEKGDLKGMVGLVECFKLFPNSCLYRKELYYEILKILKESLRSGIPLNESLVKVRENTRRLGRRMPKKAIARTLLIKGLEFDHAVILNADSFDQRNLYVALTRATKTVTIFSRSNTLLMGSN